MNFFIKKYKCSTKNLKQHMHFLYLYQILASADTVGLNYGLRLNLHLFFVYGNSDGSAKLKQARQSLFVSHCNKYLNHMFAHLIYSSSY